jgi:hypothetical protein
MKGELLNMVEVGRTSDLHRETCGVCGERRTVRLTTNGNGKLRETLITPCACGRPAPPLAAPAIAADPAPAALPEAPPAPEVEADAIPAEPRPSRPMGIQLEPELRRKIRAIVQRAVAGGANVADTTMLVQRDTGLAIGRVTVRRYMTEAGWKPRRKVREAALPHPDAPLAELVYTPEGVRVRVTLDVQTTDVAAAAALLEAVGRVAAQGGEA